jgi:hypothetical protein
MRAPHRLARALAVSALLTAAILASFASAAHAGLLTTTATGCDDPPVDKPFLPWVDVASYVLAPGGAAENAHPWKLRNGATLVAGNERFYVNDEDHDSSLRLPPGASATTNAMCVGLEHPTLRFFARTDGSLLSPLVVEVLYEDALGATRSLPIGFLLGTRAWQPTLPLLVVANLLPLLPGEQTAVAFRFTAVGTATWDIDDIYVDPWRHR